MKIFVETERLILREIEESDVEGMYALDSDPEVHKYLGGNPVQSEEEIMEVIGFIRNQYKNNGIGRWAVEDKMNGEFLGWSGLKLENKPTNGYTNYIDIGYRLRREFWGKGYATESAIAALNYGFSELKYNEIFGAAYVANKASNIVLMKIGLQFVEKFDYEGTPCMWYGLKREEWLSQKGES